MQSVSDLRPPHGRAGWEQTGKVGGAGAWRQVGRHRSVRCRGRRPCLRSGWERGGGVRVLRTRLQVLRVASRMADEAILLEPPVGTALCKIRQGTLDEFHDRMDSEGVEVYSSSLGPARKKVLAGASFPPTMWRLGSQQIARNPRFYRQSGPRCFFCTTCVAQRLH